MRRRRLTAVLGAAALAAVLMAADINPAAPQTVALTALRVPEDPGRDPHSPLWGDAAEITLSLAAQGVTYPFGGGATAAVRVRALHHRKTLYVRVQWDDRTQDDSTDDVDRFSDAVAIEFPADARATVPSVCMGQSDGGVNIWFWRADRARRKRWPPGNGYVDEEQPLFPARDAGNVVARNSVAAQDLVATGFGTLGRAATQEVRAYGTYEPGNPRDPGTWTVVFSRPFARPDQQRPGFTPAQAIDVAFAVWDGQRQERDGIKSVSEFGRLVVSRDTQPGTPWSGWWFVLCPILAIVLLGGWRLVRTPKTTAQQ